jgi:hypothetical protein
MDELMRADQERSTSWHNHYGFPAPDLNPLHGCPAAFEPNAFEIMNDHLLNNPVPPVDTEVGHLWLAAGLFPGARQYPFYTYHLAFTAAVGSRDGAFDPTDAESPDPDERAVSQCGY